MAENLWFTGGDKLTDALEKKVHEAFMVTELNNGKDAYQVGYAEIKTSGITFGGNQMDLATGEQKENLETLNQMDVVLNELFNEPKIGKDHIMFYQRLIATNKATEERNLY